jgi:hypothetical protein
VTSVDKRCACAVSGLDDGSQPTANDNINQATLIVPAASILQPPCISALRQLSHATSPDMLHPTPHTRGTGVKHRDTQAP